MRLKPSRFSEVISYSLLLTMDTIINEVTNNLCQQYSTSRKKLPHAVKNAGYHANVDILCLKERLDIAGRRFS